MYDFIYTVSLGARLKMETRRKRNPSQSEPGPKSKRPKRRNEISLSENKDNFNEGTKSFGKLVYVIFVCIFKKKSII